jgi:hypothetical protein
LQYRPYIAWSLRAGSVLLLVVIVSGLLWFFLGTMGDHSGAGGFGAVTLVALVCWGLDFVALVVLLALAELSASTGCPSTDDGEEA